MELIGAGAGIFHHLSPDFRQHRVVISDSYRVEYQRAKAAGQLSPSCSRTSHAGPPHPIAPPRPATESAYTVGMRRLAPIATLFLLSLPAMAARQVALVTEGELAPPARHGLAKLQDALRAKGFEDRRLRRPSRLRHPRRHRRIRRLAGIARRPCPPAARPSPSGGAATRTSPPSPSAEATRADSCTPRSTPPTASPGVPPTPSSTSATPPRSPTSPNAASPCTPCSAPTSRAASMTKRTGSATSTRWPPTASTASSSSSATKTAASWRRSIPTSST